MKNLVAFLYVCFIGTTTFAQNNAVVSMLPANPKIGTSVKITYNPAHPKAVLKNASAVMLVQMRGDKDLEQYPMTKQNGKWSVQLPVRFGDTYIPFYFKSSGAIDNNESHLWDVIAYEANGKPAKNAYYMRSFSYGSRGYSAIDAEKMKVQDLKKEVAENTEAFYPQALIWKAELDAAKDEATKTAIKARMKTVTEALWNKQKGKFDTFSGIQTIYRVAGLASEAETFKQSVMANQPSAEIVQRNVFSDVLRAPKGQERCDKLNAFIAQYGENTIPSLYGNSIFDTYLNCKDEANIVKWGDKIMDESYSKLSPSRTYSRMAQQTVMAQLPQLALTFAKKAVEMESQEFFADFMIRTSETAWQPTSLAGEKLSMAKDNLHGENLKALGKIYLAQKDYENAISNLNQAANLLQNDKDVYPTLANVYQEKGDFQAAFDVYFAIAKKDRTDEKALTALKTLHEKIKGSPAGFEDVTANLERIWATKPAPVYSVAEYGITRNPVQDLAETVALAKANGGKTIMLFVGGEWCTWCHALTRYFKQNEKIASVLQDNYIIMKVNFSTENENKDFLGKYPEIGGYPHIFFLDANGKLVHSQGTGEIESGIGMGYDEAKVLAVLNRWIPSRVQGK